MRLGPKVITFTALILAAALSFIAARIAADAIEDRSLQAVRASLIDAGHDWAEVHTDGLQVHIGGEAPTEALRFNALSVSGQVVEASRVIDGTTVVPAAPLEPPRFSIEILRNEDGVSLIGLVPESLDAEALVAEIARATGGAEVTSFLETARYDVPAGWVEALDYGLDSLSQLPRSKISIAAGEVAVTAISGSMDEKRRLETELARAAPDGLRLALDISAPRPVLTPFTLRFVIDEGGPRFDACAADNETGRDRILAAARAAGLEGQATCPLALGVPTPDWPVAAEMAISALDQLGGGSITFSDADVALIAAQGTAQELFDKVVGELESNLPEVFSLTSVLPEPPPEVDEAAAAPPEFSAIRSPEGEVQLRGRLPNEVVHATVESFARARFGIERVYMAARLDPALPVDWPVRVLAGLRALSELDHGSVTVLADTIRVDGVSGNRDARGEISRLLTQKLGETASYGLQVRYDEALDPLAALPTAQECIERITAIQTAEKITFAPGSTVVEGDSLAIVDDIAEVLRGCRKVDMTIEIAGHTDSQGREEMNLDLSEARAQAVLEALVARRVLTSRITAKGYGEAVPIADNGTEDGREANRRIEFRLVELETAAEDEAGDGTADQTADQTGDGTADETGDAAAPADAEATDADGDAGADTGSGDETPAGAADATATEDSQ